MGNSIFLSVLVLCASGLLYSTCFFRKSLIGMSSSPEGMPRVILAGIILCGLAILLRDWKKGLPCHISELFKGPRLVTVLCLPGYLLVLHWLGFAVATFIMLTALFCLLEPERVSVRQAMLNAALAAVLSAAVFTVFRHLFHIQLPMLGSYL